MQTDRRFLYGAVALQAGLIDSQLFNEFIELAGNAPSDVPFADLLVARGWIQPADRAHLDYLVERKLEKHAGDAKIGLASVTAELEHSLHSLANDNIQPILATAKAPESTLAGPLGVGAISETQDRYVLTSLHATGGIGRVWLARDARMDRELALKELRLDHANNATLSARFLREARITGQLEHSGIVPVYELARRRDTGQPFYTMRFVKGRTLTETAETFHQKRVAGHADPLEFSGLLSAFVLVCKTVAYAHSRGVIHRDLKGQNVVVGDFGEVVVLDWGLAKLLKQPDEQAHTPAVTTDPDASGKADLTLQGDTLGTPAYMAPEQAAGRVDLIDCHTDVYGLGAMLYHLLTGQPPFRAASTKELLRKVESEDPLPPRQLWAEVPPILENACLRALAKQPATRFASAIDLAREVEQWQEIQRQQAVQASRASEALYHSLVESIPIYVWRKDVDGRFTFANKWFCESLGTTSEQLVGKSDFGVFPQELAEKYRRDDANVLKTGQTFRTIEDHFSPTGARLVVEVIKIPIRDPNGSIVGTQGIFWDVTSLSPARQPSPPMAETTVAGDAALPR